MFGICRATEGRDHRLHHPSQPIYDRQNVSRSHPTYAHVMEDEAVWNRQDARMPFFFETLLPDCTMDNNNKFDQLPPLESDYPGSGMSFSHSQRGDPSMQRSDNYVASEADSEVSNQTKSETDGTSREGSDERDIALGDQYLFSPMAVHSPKCEKRMERDQPQEIREEAVRALSLSTARALEDDMTDRDLRGIAQMKEKLRQQYASQKSGDTYNHYTNADGFAGVPLPRVPLDPHPKYTLMRFLRARKYQVDEAVSAYRDMLIWRQENQVDALLDEDDPCEKYYQCMAPHRDHGFDRLGHPIYWESTGRVRAPKMLKIGKADGVSVESIIRRNTKHMEYFSRLCRQQSEKTGRYIGKVIVVYDMTDLTYTLDGTSIDMFKALTHNNTNYYPETMWKTYIINAPVTFRAIWAMVKPFLDPVVVTKISILGKKYLDKMVEGQPGSTDAGIELDQIPAQLGGLCRCSGVHSNGDACIPPQRDPLTTPPEQVPKCKWIELRHYKSHPQY